MSLTDILKKPLKAYEKVVDNIVYNPAACFVLGTGLGYLIPNFKIGENPDNFQWMLPAGFLFYLGSSVAKKLENKIGFTIPDEPKSISGIVKAGADLVIENPMASALVSGTAAVALYNSGYDIAENFRFFSAVALGTELYLRTIKLDRRIKRSEEKGLLKYSNALFEHPRIVSLSVGAGRFLQCLYNMNYHPENYSHPSLVGPIYSGMAFGLAAGAGCILAGSVLHSESLKTMKQDLRIGAAKLLGKKDLELNFRKSIELNDGPKKARNLVKIGNIYLKRNEKDLAFERKFEELHKAILILLEIIKKK